MGIGSHIGFDGFGLNSLATIIVIGSDFTEIDGFNIGSSSYGSNLFSSSFQYVSGVGFIEDGFFGTAPYSVTYFFSNPFAAIGTTAKYTTSETSESPIVSSTTTFEASTQYIFQDETISTTWQDITSTGLSSNRVYTNIQTSAVVSTRYALGGVNIACNRVSGLKIIFEPRIGTQWTQDGSYLQYYQLFTATGTYYPTYNNISFDKDFHATISAQTNEFSVNKNFNAGATETLTYQYTEYSNTQVIISDEYSEIIQNGKLYLQTQATRTATFLKKFLQSSTTTYITAEEFNPSPATGSIGAFFTTKAISAKTTETHYIVDNFYTYNSTFTYSGLVDTTAQYSYSVFTQEYGTNSEDDVVTQILKYPHTCYQSYYSILLGTSNSEWNKYYVQKYPLNQYAVALSSSKYKEQLANATGIIFTSYKFDRLNDFSINPKFYIPINAVQYAYNSSNQSIYTKTVQSVSIDSGFYIGSGSATISRTTYSVDTSSSTTNSTVKQLAYSGSEQTGYCGHIFRSDFSNEYWNPPFSSNKIMHTIGIMGAGFASYSMDGYFVYDSILQRTVIPDSVNAISVIGNGQITTIIASELVANTAFPYVTNSVRYVNSYNYSV